jgi:anti-anti-sigma factor
MGLTIKQLAAAGGGTCLQVQGSIDMTTRESLLDAGNGILDSEPVLELDLSEVEFMDSVGIGAVIELARVADSVGKRFIVSGRSRRVERVLEATGLQDAWR